MSWTNKNSLLWLGSAIIVLALTVLVAPCQETTEKEEWLWDRNWQSIQYIPATEGTAGDLAKNTFATAHPQEKARFIQRKYIWEKNLFFVELNLPGPTKSENAKKTPLQNQENQTLMVQYPANQEIVRIFSNFSHPKIEGAYAATEELLETTGLRNPTGKIVLKNLISHEEILLGNYAPNNRIYIGYNDSKEIILIQKNIVDSLLKASAGTRSYISFQLIEEFHPPWKALEISGYHLPNEEEISTTPRAQMIFLRMQKEIGENQDTLWKFEKTRETSTITEAETASEIAENPEEEDRSLQITDTVEQILRQLKVDQLQHEMMPLTNNLKDTDILLKVTVTDDSQHKQDVTIYQPIMDKDKTEWYPATSNLRSTVDYLTAKNGKQLYNIVAQLNTLANSNFSQTNEIIKDQN